nr:ribonuclease H [Bifidobacterium callitrichos]
MGKKIVVSTDGSALGNPNGPMGWAWADHDTHAGDGRIPGHEHDSKGYDAGGATNGTNQIGELCAVLQVLRAHPGPEPLLIESDSQYAINCSTKWLKGWKKNGWRNSQKQPVKNVEVIKAIDAEIAKRPGPVDFKWVKGHAGNAGNELVDQLARSYAQQCRNGSQDGYLPLEGWQSLLNSPYAKGTDVPPDAQLLLDRAAKAAGPQPEQGSMLVHSTTTGELEPEPDATPDAVIGSKTRTRTGKNAAKSTTKRASKHDTSKGKASAEELIPDRDGATGLPRNPRAADTSTSTTAATQQPPAQPARPANTPTPSGLKVSGEVRFSPAPKTSPYFTGESMRVRGYIAVDGFVDGDGNLTITDADFLR